MTDRLKILAISTVALLTGCGAPTERPKAEPQIEPTMVEGVSLRFVGVPDRRIQATNAVLLDPENGIDATVLQGHHNSGDGIVVKFQPSTGNVEYITTPDAAGSWSLVSLGGGEAYFGSHWKAYLHHLKPHSSEVERIELPRPDDWIFGIDRASDDDLYLGAYPGGGLLRYDIETGSIEDLGSVLPDDGRERYVRTVNGEFPGKLYLGMGAEPELVEWDLETGQRRNLLPEEYKDRSFVYNIDRVGGLLAAGISPRPVILLINPETGKVLYTIESPNGAPVSMGNQTSFVLYDDDIYFGTSGDNVLWVYNLADRRVWEVARGPGGPIGLAQGQYLFTRNSFGTYFVVDVQTQQVMIEAPTRFEGAGMGIHALGRGPDGTVVGGAYINQGFFWYDPVADTLFAPGRSVSFPGQIDQLVTHDGLIYLAHYTTARLTVYDPLKPWDPGYGADRNPSFIAAAGHNQDRYPTAIAGSDDRIYLGSIPKYGKLGGALVIYTPGSDSLEVHRNVVTDQSVIALVEDDGVVYGSTSIMGGLGSKPTQESGKLFGWDMESGTKIMEAVPVEGAAFLWGLDRLPDGKLVGSADSVLYVFDPTDRRVLEHAVAAPEDISKLIVSADGWVYAVTEERFIRASPDLATIETLDVSSDYWDSLVETDQGRLFVSKEAKLFEVLREE